MSFATTSNAKEEEAIVVLDLENMLFSIMPVTNIKDYYTNDKDKLMELKTELIGIKDVDKVKLFVINKINEFLEDVITNL